MGLILFIINGPLAIQVGSKSLANNRGKLDIVLLLTGAGGFVIVYLADVSRTLTAVVGLLIIAIVVLLFVNHKRFPSMPRQNNASTIPENLKATAGGTPSQILSILFISVLIIPLLIITQGSNDTFIRPQPDTAELINFIKTLPQDALISGYPCLLDDIPLYSQHSILFSCETESRDMNMMMTALDTYFAETEAEVLAFCREYNVDYMVASQETFTEAFRSQEHIIFEPLNSFLKQQLEGRSLFVLEQIPDNRKSFQNSTFFVFPCSADVFAPDAR